jgi:valyl-tRNA synthetase
MPFITEEIWQNLCGTWDVGRGTIMLEKWPHMQTQMINKKMDSQMKLLMDAITIIRNIRSSWNINPSIKVNAVIKAKKKNGQMLKDAEIYIRNLARVEALTIAETPSKPAKSATGIVGDMEIYIPLGGVIDLKDERQRLLKKIDELSGVIKGIESKLKNRNFTSRAPAEIVEKEKLRSAEFADTLKRLKDNLKDLERV